MSRRLPEIRRLVVKIGSASLVDGAGLISRPKLSKVVREVTTVTAGRTCVLVSSGAIATGLAPLGLDRRPRDMPSLQAAAAVGQGRMMGEYQRMFERRGLVAAQVLLTQDDIVRRRHFVNARNTLERLLRGGTLPVVNENDTTGTEEIRFGDNDRLAALVAVMIDADLLVLLSDVDGIYTSDPRRGRARLLPEVTDPLQVRAGRSRSGIGSGGMASKLEAAAIASSAGVGVVVAGASRRDILPKVVAGEEVGTWVPPRGGKRRARKAWIAFASDPRGRIVIDAGAEGALRAEGRSLLAAGVVSSEGDFSAGQTVELVGPSGRPFGRGVANYSSDELPKIAGRSSAELATLPGGPFEREVVHRDELVVFD